MANYLPATLLLLLAGAQPAAASTWSLGPPPPLPPLPTASLVTSRPQFQPEALPPLPAAPGWEVVAQAQKPRWEIVPGPTSTPAAGVTLASANLRWERVPAHERILHAHVLAIVSTPDPMELVQFDRPVLRWESFPAPQPPYAAYGSIESSAVRPVRARRVWFRF